MFERFKQRFSRQGEMPESDTYLGDFKTREEAEAGLKSLQEGVEKLKSDLEASQRQREEDGRRIDDLLVASMRQPQAAKPAKPAEPVKLPDLPDPAKDPEGYARVINERAEIQRRATEEAQQEINKKRGQLNRVWSDFQEENPKLFDNQNDLITKQFVSDELARIKDLGIDDPTDYIIQNQAQVKRSISEKATAYLDQRGLLDPKDPNKGDPPPQQQTDRAAGIPGGTNLPPQGANPGGDQYQKSSFVEEMQDSQRVSGFF